jgi:predicted MFS family arabinose efflux permease
VSAGEAAVFLLPLSIGVGAGSLITGSLHDRLGRPTVYPLIGLAVTALVLAATAYLEPCLSTTALALFLGVAALFMGTVMVSVQVTVQAEVDVAILGVASAAVQFSRSMGAAFGAAVAAILAGSAIAATGPAPLDSEAFGEAFRSALWLAAAGAAIGAVLMASASGGLQRHPG